MNQNEVLKSLKFNNAFSIEDWNSLIKLKLREYFRNSEIFEKNIEILRLEIINYIQFCSKENYLALFNSTFQEVKQALAIDESLALNELVKFFDEMTETDLKWMTNVLIQPKDSSFSEGDKIFYYFKVIDDILEGCFKPRFRLFFNFVFFNKNHKYSDVLKMDFGCLINQFPKINDDYNLYLKDPIVGIATNQWRNIAAHKSYSIESDCIIVSYGKNNMKTEILQYSQFYKILEWVTHIYKALRFSQVLLSLNYTTEIVNLLGGTSNIKVRFEAYLMHVVQNLQIVGFEFIEILEDGTTFIIQVKKKMNDQLMSSVVHASQCLDHLALGISIDNFTKEKFQQVKISVIDSETKQAASASVFIKIALKKVNREITEDYYINNIHFENNSV